MCARQVRYANLRTHSWVLFPSHSPKKKGNPCTVACFLERMMGIEPTTAAWEAAVLPLNYIRIL